MSSVQSFRNGLLQQGFSTGYSSCQKIYNLNKAATLGEPMVVQSPAPAWSPPRDEVYLIYHGPAWIAQVITCLAMVFSMGCRRISAPTPSYLTLVSSIVPHSCYVAFFTLSFFYPLPLVSLTNSALSISFGAICNWLCSVWGQLLVSSLRNHPCWPLQPKSCHVKLDVKLAS